MILPKEVVKSKHLKPNEKTLIEAVNETDLGNIFASLKGKLSGQKFKDLVRKEWS